MAATSVTGYTCIMKRVKGVEIMKGFLKILAGAVLVLLVIAAVISVPTVVRGYSMYKNAVAKVSVEQKVAEIRADRNYVTLDNISSDFKRGIVHSEDRRFYRHHGYDLIGIGRAVISDIAAGAMVQGGSTITQQLAKNMYFAGNRTLARKVAEIMVARQLEKNYSKQEILELYCNAIYYGQGCVGLKEATRHYYRIDPSQLRGDQAARLVVTVRCPECYNPSENYNYVGAAN
jgi:monofunctional glycosyltransferase